MQDTTAAENSVMRILRAAFLRALPLGLTGGLALGLGILLGWSEPVAALLGLVVPPVLTLMLVPEVITRTLNPSRGMHAVAGVVTVCTAFCLLAAVFYNAAYAGGGGAMGQGTTWLFAAAGRPNPMFGVLLGAIAVPLGALVFSRLRGWPVWVQCSLVFSVNAVLLVGPLGNQARIEPSSEVWFLFVDMDHYIPLQLGFSLLGPPLLALGDWIHSRREAFPQDVASLPSSPAQA